MAGSKQRIADFKPLASNPNRHTQRGLKELQDSIRAVGYTEPMVAAADGTILSGNARLESVAEIMDVEPIVVESDGTRPVIHKRIDIADADTDAGRKIVVGSNRIAEIDLAWDVEVLAGMDATVLDGLFDASELEQMASAILHDADNGDGENVARGLDTPSLIRLVVDVANVGAVERAIMATGEANRGDALMLICREYLRAKGQLDGPAEDSTTA